MDALLLEGGALRTPFECLSRQYRLNQKQLSKGLSAVTAAAGELAADGGASREAVAARLEALERDVRELRARAAQGARDEAAALAAVQDRAGFLQREAAALAAADPDAAAELEAARRNRLAADWLARAGRPEAARAVAEATGVAPLVDLAVFEERGRVAAALRARDCAPALQWCADNASRLRRLECPLETQLRLREFLELARRGPADGAAVAYARQHLAAAAGAPEVQQAMATLALPDPADPAGPFAALFADACWAALERDFVAAHARVFGLAAEAPLAALLAAGLTALKTPLCYSDAHRAAACPACTPEGRALAQSLPFAHHAQSTLVCRLSGQRMDENNLPLALPNGQVYGTNALRGMAERNGGVVVCPATGEEYGVESCRSVFVL